MVNQPNSELKLKQGIKPRFGHRVFQIMTGQVNIGRILHAQFRVRATVWVSFILSIEICAASADTILTKFGETPKRAIKSESVQSVTTPIATSTGNTDNTAPKSDEEPGATPDAEGFYGIPDAVIDDPDGYVNVRKEKNGDSAIIAKVKKNEPFEFQCGASLPWCRVKLKSGVTGWMHYSRIKRYYTEKDLPKGPEDSGEEIDEQARKQGVNYYEVSRAAARGEKKALKTFFTMDFDGAAAETHVTSIVEVVIHLAGDDKFAEFLREQQPDFRENISLGWDLGAFSPFDPKEYLQQHFPKSAKLVFPSYRQLIRDYDAMIKRDPKNSEAYRRRGNAEYKQEDWARAIADYSHAIEVDPNSNVAYWNRGWAHARKKEYDAAIKDMQKASQLQPNEPRYQQDIEEIKALQTGTSEE